jgi:hypothetical protein
VRPQIENWFEYIGESSPAAGIPLIVIGLSLMFMGWQFHRTAIPFTMMLVALAAGQIFLHDPTMQLAVGGSVGLVLAAISFFAIRPAVALLGGLAGCFVVVGYMSLFDKLVIPDVAHMAIAAFAFIAASSMSYIMHREMTIAVTSLIGSVLLISGMNPVLHSAVPRLHVTVTAFLGDYPGFLIPFLFGGPTLIATLMQLAQANRSSTGQS